MTGLIQMPVVAFENGTMFALGIALARRRLLHRSAEARSTRADCLSAVGLVDLCP